MKAWIRKLLSSLLLAGVYAPLGASADVANLPVTADTFITSSTPDNNAGGMGWFDSGLDGVGGVRRGLLRFDLSNIPSGSTITSAVLRLTVTHSPGHGFGGVNSTFDLFRVQAEWNEGANSTFSSGGLAANGEATWNARMHEIENWTAPGGRSDVLSTASASTFVGSPENVSYNWSGANMVTDAQFWLDHPSMNFGWLLVSQNEASPRTVRGFASREGAANAGVLQVGYTAGGSGNSSPTISITNPVTGASFTSGVVTIEATAADSDGSVTNVEFFDGTVSLGNDTSEPYSVTATLAAGSHTLTAVAKDNEGASTTSVSVTITVTSQVIIDPFPDRIPKGNITIELKTIADGMASPLSMAVPDDGSGRFFVYDQSGVIWIVTEAGGRMATPLLDVRARLNPSAKYDYDERGLLGLVAHPNFAQNPFIYTYTSETNGAPADFPASLPVGVNPNHQSVITEWRIDAANTNRVDPSSRREIMRVDKPQSNHNGGTMRFGPDGFLYVTIGDGGNANDVGNGHVAGGNAQSTMTVLGKLLRIDVDARNSANGQYGIPNDNPFDGTTRLREIYAYGLRNPFSYSFDRVTGELYLGDVGQNRVEEIDIIVKGGNYGWNIKEGTFWFDASNGTIVTSPVRPVPPDLIDPIAEYDHDDGLAVIGGFVYRGTAIAALQGRYVFADWGTFTTPSGRLFYLDSANAVKELRIGLDDRPLGNWVKGMGEGPDGAIYVFCSRVVGPAGNTGRMLKIVPAPDPISFTSIAPSNGTNATETWTGGEGPFALQKKAALSEPAWINVNFSTQSAATTNMDTSAGFFRIADTAHQSGIPLSAYLSGRMERPEPLTNSATGFGLFSLDDHTLTFNIRYAGLSGPATMAHIHGPASTANATIVQLDLAPYSVGPFGSEGIVSGQVIVSDAFKAMILAGQTYVNFHTDSKPSGELRGQIAPVLMQVSLSDANERPTALDTGARGFGVLMLVSNQLTFNITYRELSGTAIGAHIHGPATMSEIANVLIDLSQYNGGSFGTSGTLSGVITLTAEELAAVIDGKTYVNFHTTAHSDGEMRGQIVPQSTAVPLSAPVSGLSERPPVAGNATGQGLFSVEGNLLSFSISYKGLSGPALAAHIHGPTTTATSTNVLIDLAPFNGGAWGSSGTVAGSVLLTALQRDMVLNGLTYVNFHTSANPDGEIRGQLAPVLMRTYLSGASERPPVFSNGSALGNFALVLNQLSFAVAYRDLSAPATGANIHGPATVTQTVGSIIDLQPFNGGGFAASGSVVGSLSLLPSNLASAIDQLTYMNISTTNFSNGEIRGQITR